MYILYVQGAEIVSETSFSRDAFVTFII
jgi:hypothetical protein